MSLDENTACERLRKALAVYESDRDTANLLEQTHRLASQFPWSSEILGLCAQSVICGLRWGGKSESAREYAERSLSINPQNLDALAAAAFVDHLNGQCEPAIQRLRYALTVGGGDRPDVVQLLAEVLAELGELDAAIAVIQDSDIASSPSSVELLSKLRIRKHASHE